MGTWLGTIVRATGRRVILWQVPNGNRVYRTEDNTDGHWQDNRPEISLTRKRAERTWQSGPVLE